MRFRSFLCGCGLALPDAQAINPHFTNPDTTNVTIATDASPHSHRIPESFVSYSIEFGSFPDFAGETMLCYSISNVCSVKPRLFKNPLVSTTKRCVKIHVAWI